MLNICEKTNGNYKLSSIYTTNHNMQIQKDRPNMEVLGYLIHYSHSLQLTTSETRKIE